MASSTPPPPGSGAELGVLLQPSELACLDAWIARQPEPRPTRPEAVRLLMEKGLAADGMSATAEENSIPVDELNASNDE